jgi:AraC-like DNA-binding protein
MQDNLYPVGVESANVLRPAADWKANRQRYILITHGAHLLDTAELPPHQFVNLRRVKQAKELPQAGADLSLAEVALSAGFSDQSQFCRRFKRLVGVTPGQFRTPARIA